MERHRPAAAAAHARARRAIRTSSPSAAPSRVEPLETRVLFVAGELDLNFSADGKQFTDFGDTDTARAVVIQPDGKTVVAGDWDGGSADFALARYLPNGTLDTTFSGDGRANLTFGAGTFGGVERATGVALQQDGKIVAVGYTDAGATAGNPYNFAVARFNADGSLDNTFSGDGKFTHDFTNDDRAAAVAIQPDGKIVVAGSWDGGSADFGVIRLNANGTLDTTFNDVASPQLWDGDGVAHVFFGANVGASTERATSVAIAGNGDILVGGYTNAGTGGGGDVNDFALARLTTNGVLNTFFGGGDGKVTVDFGYDDRANAIAVDRQQRILLAGFDDGGSADMAVARFTPNGDLDVNFNNVATPFLWTGDGKLSFNIGYTERAFGIALEPNGVDQEIYLAGHTRPTAAGADNFVLARVRPNGTLDGSFGGGDGIQITDMGGSAQAYGAAIGADGKVVVAGTAAGNFAVARYLSELDPTFGFDGKQTTNFGDTDTARAVAVQADGKVVVAGDWDGGLADFAVARYLPNGNLDPSFSGDGRQNLTFGTSGFGGVERATAVAVQADGKIVVAGYTDAGAGTTLNPFDFAVARLNADGSPDNTFSGDGLFTYNWGNDDRVNAVALQSDGKIVLVGQWAGGAPDFAIMRLTADGSLDPSFNGSGRNNVTFGTPLPFGGDERANAVAVGFDGNIWVAGYTDANGTAGNPRDFAVARFNANGTLDTSFSGDGKFTIDFGHDDQATSVAVRPDGRVVVGGFSDDGSSDFAVAQIRGDGLDISFGGGDGKFTALTNDAAEFSTGMTLLENGKIVMVGYSNSSTGSPNNFVVARILANGSATDPSFNADGEYFIDFGGDDKAYAVAVQPDRRVVVAGTSNGNFAAARLDSAPVVTQVYVNSTQWTPAFRAYLESHGLGSATYGYAVPAGIQQINELPWINLNQVTFTFSEPLTYAFGQLKVTGSGGTTYAMDPAGFSTPNVYTASWRLPAGQFFTKDKLMLALDGSSANGIRNAYGAMLDGDWSGLNEVYPSGDGAAGGDFRFRINVLPGDTTRDGNVLADDFSAVKKKFFKDTTDPTTGDASYGPYHDVNGDGVILAVDFSEVKKRFFDTLPGPEPAGLPPIVLAGSTSTAFGSRRIRPAAALLV
jgi:uncharacterized delta-60 repeat protein